jgi:hypothetical protein
LKAVNFIGNKIHPEKTPADCADKQLKIGEICAICG